MITLGLHDLPYLSQVAFNPAPCAVTGVTAGGGDTFDCYEVGDATAGLPLAGTGFSGGWKMGTNKLLVPFGDTFETYAVGTPASGTLADGSGFSGPWLYTSTGMSIESATIGADTEKRLVMSNIQMARVMDIGSDWQRLRIGVRICMNDTGGNIGGTPRFYLGVLANPSANCANGPLGTTSHFFGAYTASATWTRATVPTRYEVGITRAVNRVGAGIVDSGSGGMETWRFSAEPTTRRLYMCVDIQKAASFTCQAVIHSTTVGDLADGTLLTLQRFMEFWDMGTGTAGTTPFLGADMSSGRSAGATNEAANGFFDSVCLAWNQTASPMKVSEVLYAKID